MHSILSNFHFKARAGRRIVGSADMYHQRDVLLVVHLYYIHSLPHYCILCIQCSIILLAIALKVKGSPFFKGLLIKDQKGNKERLMQYACNLPEAVQCSLKSDQATFNARGDISFVDYMTYAPYVSLLAQHIFYLIVKARLIIYGQMYLLMIRPFWNL